MEDSYQEDQSEEEAGDEYQTEGQSRRPVGEGDQPPPGASWPEYFSQLQIDLAGTLAPALRNFAMLQKHLARSVTPVLQNYARFQKDLARTVVPSLEFYAKFQRSLEPLLENAAKAAQMPFQEYFALTDRLQPMLESLQHHIEKTIRPLGEQLKDLWLNAMPTNWRELSPSNVEAAVTLMGRTGLGLVWVPRGAIVAELLEAPDDNTCLAILLTRSDEVIEDVEEALDQVRAHDLADVRGAALAAVRAFKEGHQLAAQALAAAALTEVIENNLDSRLARLRKEFKDVEPTGWSGPLNTFRLLALLAAMAKEVLRQFDRSPNEMPRRFNRHASLHTVSPLQYTRANALSALLVLTALIREIEESSPQE